MDSDRTRSGASSRGSNLLGSDLSMGSFVPGDELRQSL